MISPIISLRSERSGPPGSLATFASRQALWVDTTLAASPFSRHRLLYGRMVLQYLHMGQDNSPPPWGGGGSLS